MNFEMKMSDELMGVEAVEVKAVTGFKWSVGEYDVRLVGYVEMPGKEGRPNYVNLTFLDVDGHPLVKSCFQTSAVGKVNYLKTALPEVLSSYMPVGSPRTLGVMLKTLIETEEFIRIAVSYSPNFGVSIYRKQKGGAQK